MLLKRRLGVRGVPHGECVDGLGLEPALGKIAPCLVTGRAVQLGNEEPACRLQQFVMPAALALSLLVLRSELRHRHAGLSGEPLDRLGERDALRRHHELEDVTVLAAGKAVIEPLLIVDEKRWRLFGFER